MDAQDQFDALFDQQDGLNNDEAVALLTGRIVSHQLVGSGVSNTRQIEMDSGVVAFFKPLNGLPNLIAERYGHSKVSTTLAEVAAWRLAQALGSTFETLIPTTVVRFLDEFDSNAPGALSIGRSGVDSTPAPLIEAPDQAGAAALVDCLIGQQDRHGGNFLWDGSGARLSLIDHGFSLARPSDLCRTTFFVEHRWVTGMGRLTATERATLETVRESTDVFGLDSWVEPERLAALQSRATRMIQADSILPPGAL